MVLTILRLNMGKFTMGKRESNPEAKLPMIPLADKGYFSQKSEKRVSIHGQDISTAI